MNRHQRRRLGKSNGGVKIPSEKNLPKKVVDVKKLDAFFKKALN